ncbi:MAG: tRNA (guanine-N7)-methyltransferase, partial [Peptidiphaga sp.]
MTGDPQMHDQASSDPSDLEAKRRQGRVKSFSRRGGRMIRRYRNTLREHGPRYVLDLPRGDSPTTISDDARVDHAAA